MKSLLTDHMLADEIPARILMGLGSKQEDIGDLRQLQLAPLRGKGSLRLWMGAGMALVAAFTMLPSLPLALVGGWLTVALIFSLWSYRTFEQLPLGDPKLSGVAEFNLCNRHALYSAALWSIPFWLYGRAPPLDHALSMWTIALLMMLTLAIVAHSIPMACALFIIPVSLAAATALVLAGAPHLAGVAMVAGLLLSAFCIRFAQTHIRFRRAEETLHEKSETVSLLLREFEETSADWLWQTDNNRRLIHVSPRLAYALGATAEALEGVPLLQALAGDAWETGNFPKAMHDMAERMKRRDSFSNLIVPVTIGGKPRWWELSASPRLDEQGKFLGFRGVGSDVTEQRATAEQIAKMARFDNLTGLPNRLSLHEDLARALDHAQSAKSRCAMLMIDLDRFKAVNDTLGHPVGDKLLAQVAARLKGMMERGMTCGRLGGDEFAVVLHNVPSAVAAEELAQRIIATVSRPYVVDNHQLFVGASIGFAMGPQDGATVETLTRNADLALYKSKDKGGNVVAAYVASLHAQAEERRVMEQELRGALDRGEFELYYQPVVTAADGTLNGFEGLIRWNNQKLGNVSPGRFIPLAEDSRLISRSRMGAAHCVPRSDEMAVEPEGCGQRFGRTADRSGLCVGRRLGAGAKRAAAAKARDRSHRKRISARRRRRSAIARPADRARHPLVARRFRHRLFVARLSAQGRNFRRSRSIAASSSAPPGQHRIDCDHPRRRRACRQPRHVDHCRGRRDRDRGRNAAQHGLQQHPGLLLRPPDARIRRADPVPPARRRTRDRGRLTR